ncbi:MAG: SRPBCC domain-containing protein [Vicinamibacterales bacterium]
MVTTDIQTRESHLDLTQEILVRSSLASTFDALLEQMGPGNQGHTGQPLPMILEAWPGGRWFRDLGDSNGHFWGHVQAIKRPTLLEITGPLMLSFPVVSNVQYRLTAAGEDTLITLHHAAYGLIPDGYSDGFSQGWTQMLEGVKRRLRTA